MGKQLELDKTIATSASLVPTTEPTTALPQDKVRKVSDPIPAAVQELIDQAEAREAAAASRNDFDWQHDDSIVLTEQPTTAIYWNTGGNIVIRQERTWDREEDTVCIIAKQNLQAVIDKLCDLAGIGSAP